MAIDAFFDGSGTELRGLTGFDMRVVRLRRMGRKRMSVGRRLEVGLRERLRKLLLFHLLFLI